MSYNMEKDVSLKQINAFRKKVLSDTNVKLARNAAVRSDIIDVALDWNSFSQINHSFSNKISGELKVTNQKSSGRCWGFAGLNLLRIHLCRKYNLKEFEFSQNYFMFYDKLEKSNYFLESILKTLKEKWNSRLLMHLLQDPVQDGGQWDMFVNLIEKYGVAPQTVMPESFQSSNSMRMNRMLNYKLREFAHQLRASHEKGKSLDQLRRQKGTMLSTIYRLLTIHLGTPPDKFDWTAEDKKEKFIKFENLTPKLFFSEHVEINLQNYVCLINAPMIDKPYDRLYTVEYLGNVIEGNIVRYINLPSTQLKKAAIKSIADDEPVWFGCDVGKHFHRDLGVMDMDIYDYELFYGVKFGMDKGIRLEYGDSMMTHAMLFTGVDLNNQNPQKWRVENSWGEKVGQKGYYIMTDKWFDEYLYEIVIQRQYLPEQTLKILKQKPVKLLPWDPMGALAK